MTYSPLRRAAPVGILVCAICAGAAADTIFFDGFRDGDVTNDVPLDINGKPVKWTPLPTVQGTFDASSGDYLLAPQIRTIGASVRSTGGLRNTSIRSQLRLLTPSATGGAAELVARLNLDDPQTGGGYEAGINEEGTVYLTRTGVSCCFASADTDLRPLEEDVVMQLDVIGASLSMWAWSADEPMPGAPLITATDSHFSHGQAGIYYYANEPSSPLGSAIFRYVHVADMHIPEPSTLSLTTISLLGLMRHRNRRPRQQ
jgi:hypothetical protein